MCQSLITCNLISRFTFIITTCSLEISEGWLRLPELSVFFHIWFIQCSFQIKVTQLNSVSQYACTFSKESRNGAKLNAIILTNLCHTCKNNPNHALTMPIFKTFHSLRPGNRHGSFLGTNNWGRIGIVWRQRWFSQPSPNLYEQRPSS